MSTQENPKRTNRRWYRVLNSGCNRAGRRNASRILALTVPTGPTVTESTASNATVQRIYSRPYIVREAGSDVWHMVRSANLPVNYEQFMGPFKTAKGAEYALTHLSLTVSACERASKA